MIDYFLFWLAKTLAEIVIWIVAMGIFVGVVLLIAYLKRDKP
jgi:hypothetical protein